MIINSSATLKSLSSCYYLQRVLQVQRVNSLPPCTDASGHAVARSEGNAAARTWGAPFMMRVTSPVLLFFTCAIVYLSVGLKGTKRCSV